MFLLTKHLLQGCLAEVALAGLLAYAATDTSTQMSHSASIGAIVLVSQPHLSHMLSHNMLGTKSNK